MGVGTGGGGMCPHKLLGERAVRPQSNVAIYVVYGGGGAYHTMHVTPNWYACTRSTAIIFLWSWMKIMKHQRKIYAATSIQWRDQKRTESSLSGESDSEIDPLDDNSDEGEPSSCSLQGVARKPESTTSVNECCQSQVEASTPYQRSDKAALSTTWQKSGQKFRSLNPKWCSDFK